MSQQKMGSKQRMVESGNHPPTEAYSAPTPALSSAEPMMLLCRRALVELGAKDMALHQSPIKAGITKPLVSR
jgi:hypothetical protein